MTHINQRRDTSANWTSTNPVLQLGEVGWETNTRKCKLGDGVTAWADLEYANPSLVSSVAGKIGDVELVPSDIGLGSVNNTADNDKPVSGPQAAADADVLAAALGADAAYVPKSLVNSKGDLLVGSAPDTVVGKAVDVDGSRLVADSGQTDGLRWTTALFFEGSGSPEGVVSAPIGSEYSDIAGGTKYIKNTGIGNTGWVLLSAASAFPYVELIASAATTGIGASTWTKVNLATTAHIDGGSSIFTVSGSVVTFVQAGIYDIWGYTSLNSSTVNTKGAGLVKNGGLSTTRFSLSLATSGQTFLTVSAPQQVVAAADTVQLAVISGTAGDATVHGGDLISHLLVRKVG